MNLAGTLNVKKFPDPKKLSLAVYCFQPVAHQHQTSLFPTFRDWEVHDETKFLQISLELSYQSDLQGTCCLLVEILRDKISISDDHCTLLLMIKHQSQYNSIFYLYFVY